MKRRSLTGLMLCLLGAAPLYAQNAGGGRGANAVDWNAKMPWASWEAGDNTYWNNPSRGAQGAEPFKIFDNLYYVGIATGQSLLIPTSDGLILIDGTWAETADMVLASIRKVGFDPVNIKY